MQKQVEEQLDEASHFAMHENGKFASVPWIQKQYEPKPGHPFPKSITATSRLGTQTVSVPKFRPGCWQESVREAFGEGSILIQQIGPEHFQAFGEDDVKNYKVRFQQADLGEARIVRLFQRWDDTPESIRAGLQTLHPGKEMGEMWFDGPVVDDDSEMVDWMSTTGTSNTKVNWMKPPPPVVPVPIQAEEAMGMPIWTLFHLFPVDNAITVLGTDDVAYSIDWIEGKQY
jgi:hypothetical protein